MDKMVFTKDYPINITLLDVNQQVSLTGFLSILQDMAFQHADVIGYGYHESIAKNEFWVFSQQSIRIHTMPEWNDVLTVETSVCDIGNLSAIREFSLSVNGTNIGECAMQCMLLDQTTHRPKRLKGIIDSLHERTSQFPELRPDKIKLSEQLKQQGTHIVTISDLDLNQHVNNTKYAQWALDTLPLSLHTKRKLERYDVNFLAETFLDDTVRVLSDYQSHAELLENGSSQPVTITFSGERESDNKKLFSAQFHYS